MARGPGAMKRQKELERLEWQKRKAERRRQRKQEKEDRARRGDSGAPFEEAVEPQAVDCGPSLLQRGSDLDGPRAASK